MAPRKICLLARSASKGDWTLAGAAGWYASGCTNCYSLPSSPVSLFRLRQRAADHLRRLRRDRLALQDRVQGVAQIVFGGRRPALAVIDVEIVDPAAIEHL